jgi:glycosyltransferase involved in cell wall biosynthesis
VQETPQENTLIFTGSFSYSPNFEAMIWFVNQVYPLIQAQAPEVRLMITGDQSDRVLPLVKNVTLTGLVDDVRPLIARSWVSLVPILTGGGTRLKILEAMALHVPVVSTEKGAEGLDVKDGQHLLIANTPESFAEAVLCLVKDHHLRRRLVDSAYGLVRERYDQSVVIPRFLNFLSQVAQV